MISIACVVEGHGEVEALPVLLRRIAGEHGTAIQVRKPHRVPRSKPWDEWARAIALQQPERAERVAPRDPAERLLGSGSGDRCGAVDAAESLDRDVSIEDIELRSFGAEGHVWTAHCGEVRTIRRSETSWHLRNFRTRFRAKRVVTEEPS